MSVLNLKDNGGNIVDSVINAIVAGYRDDLVLEELASAIEAEKITKEQFQQCADALNLYAVRFNDSIQNIGNAMKQFEFNDQRSIIKNRPLNLAQQVLKDVEGFNNASNEFHGDDDAGEKEADIKKPAPVTTTPAPVKKETPSPAQPVVKKEAPKKEELKKAI